MGANYHGLFRSPLSLILAAAAILCIIVLRRTRLARLCSEGRTASILMAAATILLAIEGSWPLQVHRNAAFIAIIAMLMFSLGQSVLQNRGSLGGKLCHIGLFLVLAGGLFGAIDITEATIRVNEGSAENTALGSDGKAFPLPFYISLEDFEIETYEGTSSPRQYTSTIEIDGRMLQTGVNHPARHKGWRIYQTSYGEDQSGTYTVLKVVKNPWLAVVALGAILLAAGALLSMGSVWRSRKILLPVVLLAAVFTLISLARINFGTLQPALRSLWFVPHLAVYMLAYAVLALAVIAGIGSRLSGKVPQGLERKLLSTASSLLLIGMTCGAVWAQQAWGSYWTWDPKECWAAATWLLTLAATHLPSKHRKAVLCLTIIAFLAMNITWYGVNYLPSSEVSLHTYNR